MAPRIHLRVSNKQAYVWDVKDISALRSEHRVCGLLAGTLPRMSQQNIFLGAPLILLPEEVVLLVENEIADIINDKQAHNDPTDVQKDAWQRAQETERLNELTQKEVAVQLVAGKKSSTKEATARRLEREQRRAALGAKTSSERAAEHSMDDMRPESPSASDPSRQTQGQTAPLAAYSVKVPSSSSELAWYSPEEHTYTTLDAARSAGVWSYPQSSSERARCGVYRELWEKGYYMGCGIKFGGDFLVYPGDPLRYHSHFVVTVVETDSAALRPMEIVAHGRLGTATKKAHLLCSWDDNAQKADVFSIEWAGFG